MEPAVVCGVAAAAASACRTLLTWPSGGRAGSGSAQPLPCGFAAKVTCGSGAATPPHTARIANRSRPAARLPPPSLLPPPCLPSPLPLPFLPAPRHATTVVFLSACPRTAAARLHCSSQPRPSPLQGRLDDARLCCKRGYLSLPVGPAGPLPASPPRVPRQRATINQGLR